MWLGGIPRFTQMFLTDYFVVCEALFICVHLRHLWLILNCIGVFREVTEPARYIPWFFSRNAAQWLCVLCG
jgi:hypothetical protein